MLFPGKRVQTKDGRFKVEISNKELEGMSQSKTQEQYLADWMRQTAQHNEWWDSLSEEQKAAYQKKHYITEKYFLTEDEDGNEVPYMKWTLNTDWTWNIWDMEKGIEYLHCYPTAINRGSDAAPDNTKILEEFKIKLEIS